MPQTRGVNVLVKPIQTKVERVDAHHLEVVIDPPASFDITKPIYCKGTQLEVIHAEADALWVQNVSEVGPGDTIAQTQCKGL